MNNILDVSTSNPELLIREDFPKSEDQQGNREAGSLWLQNCMKTTNTAYS